MPSLCASTLIVLMMLLIHLDAGASLDIAKNMPSKDLADNADGMAHDFPQRIIYEHKPGGSLMAWIEGQQDDQMHRIPFPFTAAACVGEDREH